MLSRASSCLPPSLPFILFQIFWFLSPLINNAWQWWSAALLGYCLLALLKGSSITTKEKLLAGRARIFEARKTENSCWINYSVVTSIAVYLILNDRSAEWNRRWAPTSQKINRGLNLRNFAGNRVGWLKKMDFLAVFTSENIARSLPGISLGFGP